MGWIDPDRSAPPRVVANLVFIGCSFYDLGIREARRINQRFSFAPPGQCVGRHNCDPGRIRGNNLGGSAAIDNIPTSLRV
jgi:hypothetical protein